MEPSRRQDAQRRAASPLPQACKSPALGEHAPTPTCGRRDDQKQQCHEDGRERGTGRLESGREDVIGGILHGAGSGEVVQSRNSVVCADATRRPQRPESTYKYSDFSLISGPALLASTKLGTIQRRLAWPLRKDDTHNSRRIDYYALADLDLNQCDVVR